MDWWSSLVISIFVERQNSLHFAVDRQQDIHRIYLPTSLWRNKKLQEKGESAYAGSYSSSSVLQENDIKISSQFTFKVALWSTFKNYSQKRKWHSDISSQSYSKKDLDGFLRTDNCAALYHWEGNIENKNYFSPKHSILTLVQM